MKTKMKQKNIKSTLSGIFVSLMLFVLMMGSVYAAQPAVDLGTAGNFVILAKSGISTTGTTSITGNMGVSPIDSTAITGFGLIMDASDTFATSSLLTGKAYAADYTSPTPTTMTTAVSDMETAYTDAAGRTETSIVTELGAGDISGMTLSPGLYKWGTGVLINTGVTLSGSSTDVWIFQIAEDLTVGDGAIITLSGGAQAKNIFWQVGGQATLGTTSAFKGIILSQTAIAINTGATLNGRALAQTAVTLDANAVTAPDGSAASALSLAPTPTANSGGEGSAGSGGSSSGISGSGSLGSGSTGSGSSGSGSSVTKITTPVVIASASRGSTTSLEQAETKENIIARINLRTGLNISLSDDATLGAALRVHLSNGKYALIKVIPAEASVKAQAVLNAKCDERNCTVELKESNVNGEPKAVYDVKIVKKVKLLGVFNVHQNVQADVDAETGEVVTKRPWWSFLAKD